MKIVLNKKFGGFGLSKEASQRLESVTGMQPYAFDDHLLRRHPDLVAVVEEMGQKANGLYASLCVVNIPDNFTDLQIMEFDGMEKVVYVLDGYIHFA